MSGQALASVLTELLLRVAPDIDARNLRADQDLRDQFDFDSMDQLNFALALHERFGIEIPERDYRELASLDKAAAYLRRRGAQSPEVTDHAKDT